MVKIMENPIKMDGLGGKPLQMVGFSICHVRFPRGLYTASFPVGKSHPRPKKGHGGRHVFFGLWRFGGDPGWKSLENLPKKGWIFFIAMFTDKYIWYMYIYNVYMYICNTYVYYYV